MGTIAEMLERRGREQGVIIGEQQGRIENAQEMVIEFAGDRYGTLPLLLERDIRSIQSVSALKNLGRQIMKLDNREDFAGRVKNALENNPHLMLYSRI